jgi:hypothetical protein
MGLAAEVCGGLGGDAQEGNGLRETLNSRPLLAQGDACQGPHERLVRGEFRGRHDVAARALALEAGRANVRSIRAEKPAARCETRASVRAIAGRPS